MKRIIIVAAMLLLPTTCFAQENQTPKPDAQKTPAAPSQPSEAKQTDVTAVELQPFCFSSVPRRPLPTITLQRALKYAESYLKKQNVKLSLMYLVSAKYDVLGSGSDEIQWWIFRWVGKNGQVSNTELYVSMKGIVWNPPTM